jgi:hypothetical protein
MIRRSIEQLNKGQSDQKARLARLLTTSLFLFDTIPNLPLNNFPQATNIYLADSYSHLVTTLAGRVEKIPGEDLCYAEPSCSHS